MNRFLIIKVSHLPWWNSYHMSLLLRFNEVPTRNTNISNKWKSRFHYEQAWEEEKLNMHLKKEEMWAR